jgi:hypothetical protein
MKIVDEKTIQLDRELSELDQIVLKFVNILQKYVNYVLISGYVAILFGRSRGTEDVDFIIEKMSQKKFFQLYEELLRKGFWSISVDDPKELFMLLNEEKLAVRFAEKGKVFPNMEVKFVRDALDTWALKERIKIITKNGDLFTSQLEMQIAYKKFILKSPKDLEDARHLQKLFNVEEDKINKYKLILEQYGRI